jgi:cell division protein ZapA (FtsZ GTPase activity inhibitor)
MSEKSIKVTICGRSYPLTVNAAEEARVNEAAKLINDRVQHLEKTFLVKDKQDLLAMVALQFATQYLESKSGSTENQEILIENLNQINRLLETGLSGKTAAA